MSSDTTSSVFPDRPIHPLPKRRLRERLSSEVADSIQYPAAPATCSQLFPYPYDVRDQDSDSDKGSQRAGGTGGGHVDRGLDTDSDDSSRARRSAVPRSAPTIGRSGRPSSWAEASRQAQQAPQAHAHEQTPSSTSSSLDGYDLIETNNKKKRKVPESALGAHGPNDMGSASGGGQIAPSTPPRSVQGDSAFPYNPYRGMGTSGSGMCGPGRGRIRAARSGRGPLSEGSNNSKLQSAPWSPLPTPSSGIISNAIAQSEKYPTQQGQENVSLLQQPQSQSAKPGANSTQFTFTCESQVPGTVNWSSPTSSPESKLDARGDLKSPSMSGASGGQSAASKPGKPATFGGGAAPRTAPHPAPHKRTRRRPKPDPDRIYLEAAAERKRQTQIRNAQNPPKPEDSWTCLFCEYESIFGSPPMALIRQYEIKEMKKRKEEENLRRLKEKAAAKGRKNKKAPKSTAKNAPSTAAHGHAHNDQDEHQHDSSGDDEDDHPQHGPVPPDKQMYPNPLYPPCSTCGTHHHHEEGPHPGSKPAAYGTGGAGSGDGGPARGGGGTATGQPVAGTSTSGAAGHGGGART